MKRLIIIAATALLVLLTTLALLGKTAGSGMRPRFPSSLAGEREGILAFRRLLIELDKPVQTLGTGWDSPALDRNGLLIVTTPLQRGIRAEEVPALSAWVRNGGSLLVVEDATILEQSPELESFLEEVGLERVLPLTELDHATLKPARPSRYPSSGGSDLPDNLQIRRVQTNTDCGINPSEPAGTLLVSDDGRTTAAATGYGEGRIVLVLGPLLANDRLLEGDTLNLALWLVDDLRNDGVVWFDEYHHGFGGMLANLGVLNRTALGWAALQAALAALLYALTRGIRFGPARTVPEPPRRSNLEFVHSMASMYRRASAGRHALAMMLTRLRREGSRLTGGSSGMSTAELGSILSDTYRMARGSTTMALRAAELAAGKDRLSDRELLLRAGELALLQREVTGEHPEGE